MALESILSQYFLNPIGLLALLGLLPLIAFYLIRPRPEERVMPSIAFFMEDQEKGKIDRALEKLLRNILLLVHILMIIGIAAALANLYVEGNTRPEKSVIVIDRSASTGDMGNAKSFVRSNLGEENTLIVAGEDIEIPLERASASRVRQQLSSIQSRDVETDIAGALELVSDYQGTVVVASDLDQTVSERSVEDLLKGISVDRDVRLMEAQNENSWGIIDTRPGKRNSSVDIKNFLEEERTIDVKVNGQTDSRTIGPGEVETVTFSSSKLNQVELEKDSMTADNKAYISVPKDQDYRIAFISDSGNPYFEKAVELIDFTSIRTYRPPVQQDMNADVYVIGETDRLLKSEVENIKQEVREGASLIVFAQPGLQRKGLDFLPGLGSRENVSVEIEKPRRINVGGTQVYQLNGKPGKSLSRPENAVRKFGHGEGEVLLYNIRDEDFRYDFLYPVFWKEMLADLTGRPSINELNIRTGQEINESWVETPGGQRKDSVVAKRSGFYNTSRGVYAVNLLSEDESSTETGSMDLGATTDTTSKQNLQKLAAILLAVLAFVELVYLRYTGDI